MRQNLFRRRPFREVFVTVMLGLFMMGHASLADVTSVLPPLELPRNFASIQIVKVGPESMIASGCPVGLGAVAFTAKHVAIAEPTLWIDPLDNTQRGYIRVATKDENLDLATVARVGGGDGVEFFPHPHQISKHPPVIGEEIIVDGAVDAAPTRWYGRAAVVQNGLFYVDVNGWPGSSGGCVLSLKTGEVYAIVNGPRADTRMLGYERALLRTTPIWGR